MQCAGLKWLIISSKYKPFFNLKKKPI
uniref:Uncharacterized protein n=1 Tax=Anguilla anguilla TaxID=7936 RepID=A0A0E9XVP0_ANGAN